MRLISILILFALSGNKVHAQFMGIFSIQAVVGLPDTLVANTTYSFAFLVKNVGNTLYSGSINFDFRVNGSPGGNIQSFGANQVGGFTPGDTVLVPVTYNFSINNNTFNIGDNVVVVWPRAINANSAADSLTFHVYLTNINNIDENEKTNSDLKIFPNPADDFVNFISVKKSIDEVKLYDITGKLILRNKTVAKIFTGNFIQGIYIAEVRFTDGTVDRRKFIAGRN